MGLRRRFQLPSLILLFVLAAAAGLRFYDLNWDGGTMAHPDERSTVVYYAPTMRWPDDPATLLDPRASTLNPFWDVSSQSRRSYTYGHFPLYTLVLVVHGLNSLTPLATSLNLPPPWVQFLGDVQSWQGYSLVGRALVALSDLVTVYLVFLLGRRLYGIWAGVLAAALSAFTVLQIQLAHFFAVDPISTTFTLLALYGAILMVDRPSKSTAVLTGVGIGLAVASKFSALPIAFVPIAAGYLRQPSEIRNESNSAPGDDLNQASAHNSKLRSHLSVQTTGKTQNSKLFLVLLALGVAFIVFAATSPYVLLDFENFKRAVLDEQGNMVSGVADYPFTRQYRGTLAYWYFIEQQIRWGMGWPLGLLALTGLGWVVVKAISGRAKPGEWLILGWIVLYFGPTGLFLAKFMRYMIPVVPLFTLFGAGLVAAIWRLGNDRRPPTTDRRLGVEDLGNDRRLETGEQGREGTISNLQPPISNLPSLQPRTSEASNHLPSGREGPTFQPPALSQGGSNLPKLIAAVLAVVVLAGAIFWSLAFVNGVYGSDHPWATFARWVYANVPNGACIAREHWDEGIPASLPEPGANPGAHGYFQPELPMYEEDSQEKYENLRATLMNCDYIALASNRLWRTIPRLPERYPMSTRYYQALFSGDLGFEQVYTVQTSPRLGPLVIDDQSADESFTVYDHPRPILFKKTRQLSPAEWDAILGNTWQGAIPGYVGAPTLLMRLRGDSRPPGYGSTPESDTGEGDKSLLLGTPVDQLPVVNDFRWNTLANNSTPLAILTWWLAVTLIGLLALPLTFLLFNWLPDRGYILSKSLGLLLVSYFVWLNSSLGGLSNTLPTIIVALVLLAGFNLWAAVVQRHAFSRFWRQQFWLIGAAEVVFGLVYLFFVYLRLLNPDLWQPWLGGEKMLEIGFLHAIVKSAQMPPYDPFFAGGIINYYYYGLFIVGVLVKLTGIQPTIAFNLAVPMLGALTAANAFSLAGNLAMNRARPTSQLFRFIGVGLLAVLFIVFIGNLEGAAQFLRELGKLSTSDFTSGIPGLETLVRAIGGLFHVWRGEHLAMYNYWDPTRVIPATINEFPYFSFLFADLHPHMIGLPFTILFLSLAFNWLLGEGATQRLSESANGEVGADKGVEQPAEEQPVTEEPLLAPADEPVSAPEPTSWSADDPNHLAIIPYSSFRIQNSKFRSHLSALRGGFALQTTGKIQNYLLRWLALPFVLGALAVINTWDLPTYLGLMVATFLLGRYRGTTGTLTPRQGASLLASSAVFAGFLLIITYLLYAPFFANYHALDVGLGLVYTQTALDQHLKIWGFFLFVIVSWLVVSLLYPGTRFSLLRIASLTLRRWSVWPHLHETYRALVRRESDLYQVGLWGLGGVVLVAGLLFLLDYRVPAYLLPLVALALLLLLRREGSAATAYLNLLAFTGLLVLLGVEFFFLRDFLGGGEYYRMNTLFKFFIQVWVIFGLVTAVVLPWLWARAEWWAWPVEVLWRLSLVLLLMAALVYPIFATRTRVNDRFPGEVPPFGTLDGLAYMTVGVFEWPAGSPIYLKYDYEAIRWLQENVPGTPVIAEAKVGFYREGGMRVAAYTGLPSILGGLHQNEQRYPSQVGARDFTVTEFWTNPDPTRTLQLIRELNISYIYLGQVERITHGDYIQAKFEMLRQQGALEVVFENELTKIYRVK